MPHTARPLDGLNVIEFDAIGPVPFVGMKLLEMGAHVTRVLPPVARALDIGLNADSDLLNRGKASLSINLKQADGMARLHEELASADVVLEGFRPGVLERLQLSPSSLCDRYPRLVIGRLSGFGRRGPLAARAGHDINYLALSGALVAIGPAERPCVPLNLIADFGGGAMHLLCGVLAALVQRGIKGSGGVVDTSILAGTLGLTPMLHALLQADQWTLTRESNLLDGGRPFYRLYGTADAKFVAVGALEPTFFAELLVLTDLDGDIDAANQHDPDAWPAMTEAFARMFALRTRDEWAEAAALRDCCVSPVLDAHEALAYAQNRANGSVSDAPFPHPSHTVRFDP